MKPTNKDLLQETLSKEIINFNYNGILYLPTGTGKTKIIIEALMQESRIKDILWVCATEKARDTTVKEEYQKWSDESSWNKVKTICWHSLPKYDIQHQLVILDELHMITYPRLQYLLKKRPAAILGITGTKPQNPEKLKLIQHLKLPIIHEKTVEEAVTQQLIADYEIEIYYIQLNNTIKKSIKRKNDSLFYATEQESYIWYTKKLESAVDPVSRKKLALRRASIIYNSISKLFFSKKLLATLSDKRIVSFSKSISIAEQLSPNRYHSKLSKKLRKKIVQDFNEKEFNHLATVEAANTSENFNEIDVIYIHQLDSNSSNYLQRQGRGLRMRNNYIAKIIIVCAKNTVDEIWVEKCIESLNINKITKTHVN
ncbi:MAG: hypothetical protein KBG30_12850 [Bacteroidales bacterium]|nr:hypothetical protein [Bacteroidales bacterium]